MRASAELVELSAAVRKPDLGARPTLYGRLNWWEPAHSRGP
jgi:hypothetical protein